MYQTITYSKSFSALMFALMILFFPFFIRGQEAGATTQISLAVGASYGIAPTLSLGNTETSGNFASIYGDATINHKIIGRAQMSQLITSSLADGYDQRVESGWAFNGSLGYNVTLSSLPKLQFPIMGTMGYASIKRSDSFIEPGMQVGVTLAPKYYISENILFNASLRYLQGVEVDNGSKLGQTDASFGIMIRLL